MRSQFTMCFKRKMRSHNDDTVCAFWPTVYLAAGQGDKFLALCILSQIRNFSIVNDLCRVFLADLLCFLPLSCILPSRIVVCFACVDYRSIAHSGARTPFLLRHSREPAPFRALSKRGQEMRVADSRC